ncbi:MAG: Nucleolar protein 12 [Watsoniomyces obsoletus]|nr:MAG: Nucleolar protein 12 [Watsoniomyces obsoletus]
MVIPRSTYYDREYRQAASLIRARRPYLIKNAVTGLALFGFTVCVYAYTIHAIAQDDFEDVPIPDAPPPQPAKTLESVKTINPPANVPPAGTATGSQKGWLRGMFGW